MNKEYLKGYLQALKDIDKLWGDMWEELDNEAKYYGGVVLEKLDIFIWNKKEEINKNLGE